jgi:hypothetical protein
VKQQAISPRGAAAALLGMMVVSVAVRILLARSIATPWILSDEFTYSELARSVASSGHFLIRGAPVGVYSYLYPVLIAPAWLAGSMHTTYLLAKAINSIVMTLVAAPVYLWGRRFASPALALSAAALTLLIPALFYTGELMTENAFLPTYVFACFALALVLERPTLLNQGLLLIGIGLTIAVRFQGLVLVAVLPCAVLLKLLFDLVAREEDRRQVVRRDLLALWPTAAALLALFVAYVAYKHAQGVSLRSGLGNYAGATSLGYSFTEAARWTLYHFADLPLMVGYLPVCAFLVLLALAVWRPLTLSSAERALVAVGLPATVLLVVEVATYASRQSLRVEERYMFPASALLVLALVAWLGRGAPRPVVPTALAVVVPVLLLLPLPLGRLLNVSITSDTFGLIPLLRLSNFFSGGEPLVKKLVIVGGIVGSALFAFVPRRYASPVLIGAVAAFFVLVSYSVRGSLRDYSHSIAAATGVLSDPTWVDDRVGPQNVSVFFGNTADPFTEAVALWENEFWNKQLGRVYTLGFSEPAAYPETKVAAPGGRLTAAGAAPELQRTPYMLTSSNSDLAGREVAEHGSFSLYRLQLPPRIATSVAGVYADGWSGADASFSDFTATRPARVRVTVSRPPLAGKEAPGRVSVSVTPAFGRPPKPFLIRGGKTKILVVRTPGRPYAVHIHVDPTFSPSQFGYPDTRQLGARVSFAENAVG